MPQYQNRVFFCEDLPTEPQPDKGIILVTGASGYIGGRLVPELLERGYRVRVLVRSLNRSYGEKWPGADIFEGDALDMHSLMDAMENVTVAYYLIHSLLLGPRKFERREKYIAENFRRAAEARGVERIIYLGGLGDKSDTLSTHLRSRLEVADELQRSAIPVTILRAAIIIGSGSASFEIIKNLVERMPFICLPHCAVTACQPIGIRDVIKYLVGCLETDLSAGKEYDIGGNEIISYEQMMRIVAEILDKKRYFLKLPLNLNVFSYLASFLTPVPAPITQSLMQGLKNEVVCHNTDITGVIPFTTVTFRQAVNRAIKIEAADAIMTRWSNAYPSAHSVPHRLADLDKPPRYFCSYAIRTSKQNVSLFQSICRIGGKEGWFHNNWMWRIRGQIDRILMGVGTARGRRQQSFLMEGDVIDFFRVERLKNYTNLLLRAEMKLPGLAWLEFKITPVGMNENKLIVTAYFEPKGLPGVMYWYFFLPFHYFIFRRLIQAIEKRSRGAERM